MASSIEAGTEITAREGQVYLRIVVLLCNGVQLEQRLVVELLERQGGLERLEWRSPFVFLRFLQKSTLSLSSFQSTAKNTPRIRQQYGA